jgi:hypothetical protein
VEEGAGEKVCVKGEVGEQKRKEEEERKEEGERREERGERIDTLDREGAKSVISFWIRSAIPGKSVDPPVRIKFL